MTRFFTPMIVACAFVFTVALIPTLAFANCSPRGTFPNFGGDTVELIMETDDGFCAVNFRLGSRDNMMLKTLKITQQPGNGVAKATPDYNLVYWAVKGFSGTDGFSSEVCAEKNGTSGCSIIHSKVIVSAPSTSELTPALYTKLTGKKQ